MSDLTDTRPTNPTVYVKQLGRIVDGVFMNVYTIEGVHVGKCVVPRLTPNEVEVVDNPLEDWGKKNGYYVEDLYLGGD